MCSNIGVDPLASNKGVWAQLLGFGDFYYELGVQVRIRGWGFGRSATELGNSAGHTCAQHCRPNLEVWELLIRVFLVSLSPVQACQVPSKLVSSCSTCSSWSHL